MSVLARRAQQAAAGAASVDFPLVWTQSEPGSSVDLTTTSATPSDLDTLVGSGTAYQVSFTGPASGLVVVIINAWWLGSSALVAPTAVMLREAGTLVPGSLCEVLLGAIRWRWEYRVLLSVTPGQAYTWDIAVSGDGTHAFGVRVGPEQPLLLAVIDADTNLAAHDMGRSLQPPNDGTTTAGGLHASNPFTTTWSKAVLESGASCDFPVTVVPASGKVMVAWWCTAVSAPSGSNDQYLGVWDNTAGAFLAGSGMSQSGGVASARNHPHFRKIISGLTPGATLNWSLAGRVSASTATIGIKVDQDAKEGPWIGQLTAVD